MVKMQWVGALGRMRPLAILAVAASFVGACDAGDDPPSSCQSSCDAGNSTANEATAAELTANPAAYVGRTIHVTGAPSGGFSSVTSAACPSLPCNWGYGGFVYGGTGGSTAIGLSASSSFVPTVVAGTATPPSVVPLPSATTTFGCVGHELEQVCAPAIPEAIVGVVGRLEQLSPSNAYELRVDSIELGTAPPSTASCYWTSEPSCVRHTATTPVGADGG